MNIRTMSAAGAFTAGAVMLSMAVPAIASGEPLETTPEARVSTTAGEFTTLDNPIEDICEIIDPDCDLGGGDDDGNPGGGDDDDDENPDPGNPGGGDDGDNGGNPGGGDDGGNPNPGNPTTPGGGGSESGNPGGGPSTGAPSTGSGANSGVGSPGLGNSVPQGAGQFDSSLGGFVAGEQQSVAPQQAAAGTGDQLPDAGASENLNLMALIGAAMMALGAVLLRRPYAGRHRIAS